MRDKNSVVLISGCSSGIGLSLAREFASRGCRVFATARKPEVIEHLRKEGMEIAALDVTDQKSIDACVAEVIAKAGRIDILVNNAGVAPKARADLLEVSEESYDYVVDTNLKGVFFLTQAFARDMVAAKKTDPKFAATIINITSISATVVSIDRGEYCVAKAGLSMLSQLFATRLGPDGILDYEVRPGVIKTDMTAGVAPKYDKLIAGGLNIQPRWGYPEDAGKAVASLARGDFPFSAGQVIMVDGGLSIPRL